MFKAWHAKYVESNVCEFLCKRVAAPFPFYVVVRAIDASKRSQVNERGTNSEIEQEENARRCLNTRVTFVYNITPFSKPRFKWRSMKNVSIVWQPLKGAPNIAVDIDCKHRQWFYRFARMCISTILLVVVCLCRCHRWWLNLSVLSLAFAFNWQRKLNEQIAERGREYKNEIHSTL